MRLKLPPLNGRVPTKRRLPRDDADRQPDRRRRVPSMNGAQAATFITTT